jgi:hypothetical protein
MSAKSASAILPHRAIELEVLIARSTSAFSRSRRLPRALAQGLRLDRPAVLGKRRQRRNAATPIPHTANAVKLTITSVAGRVSGEFQTATDAAIIETTKERCQGRSAPR